MNEVTQILESIESGDARAEDLLPVVYDELRKLAAYKISHESLEQTLQPTALVHEAWLKLVDKGGRNEFKNRAHFFNAAAEAMRRILIDRARRKRAIRHGGGQQHENVHEIEIAAEVKDDDLLALDDALEKFSARDPQKGRLVKLRYFAGLTIPQAAEILGISEPTAKRHWAFARAWLHAEIKTGQAK
jgi:RNA polymerase sigma factor (TIGR02999 family)